jgi:hypothetical protein
VAVVPQQWWATVTWTTNVVSDSRVDVGLSGYEWVVEAYVPPSTSHQVILKGLTAGKTYHYRVRSRDANGNEAVSGDATFTTLASTKAGTGGSEVVEPVSWTSHVNISFDRLSIWKTAGQDADDAGAVSTQEIAQGNGYVEFTVQETNTERWIGLSNGDSGTGKNDIDFAIRLSATGNASARENGHRMASVDYAPGDTFRVEVRDGAVLYLKNGEVFYTSDKVPTYPLVVDTSFVTVGATFRDLVMSYVTLE